MNSSTQTHWSTAGTQPLAICAAPVASTASTTTSRNQYSQPTLKPAQRPSARSACTENEPEAGIAADISPSIRMTSIASAPAIRYEQHDPGPATRDARAGAHEQARADHSAQAQHGQMALLEARGQRLFALGPAAREGSAAWVGASCMGSYSRKGRGGGAAGGLGELHRSPRGGPSVTAPRALPQNRCFTAAPAMVKASDIEFLGRVIWASQ